MIVPVVSRGRVAMMLARPSFQSIKRRTTTVPMRYMNCALIWTRPSVTRISMVSTSDVSRATRRPTFSRSKNPRSKCMRWSKTLTRIDRNARSPKRPPMAMARRSVIHVTIAVPARTTETMVR